MQDRLDFSPAKWIWYPSQRTLANSFVLFRKVLTLPQKPVRATGFILADSRYRLSLNGKPLQRGPAPADPRFPQADPVDLTAVLNHGTQVIGVEVLYFGHGDGTWVTGKPGLIFKIELIYADGRSKWFVSDASWQCYLDRAHPPGQYKRWYLRSLQEVFDARLHPYDWNTPAYRTGPAWHAAMVLDGPSDRPSLCSSYSDYLFDSEIEKPEESFITARKIPLLQEHDVLAKGLAEYGKVYWQQDPEDWFQFRTPSIMTITRLDEAKVKTGEGWQVPAAPNEQEACLLTFEWQEQIVGYPYFTVIAPKGTIVELICQESHEPGQTMWLDTHKYSWTRFICKEGLNVFETFDYESLRWLQLHIRQHRQNVEIQKVGVRRKMYPWPHTPRVRTKDTSLQRLLDACVNTIYNNALETIVDGNGRERQQYSGDIGHELPAIRLAFGEWRLPRRFLETFSQGLTQEGYFLDCWPAYDRIVRLPQRQMGLTRWGPILDHGIQFVFDNWNHYFETGDASLLQEIQPRLIRFGHYLEALIGQDGLLPTENLGVPWVWIDNHYPAHRYKQCAFNLYAAAMYMHALAPLTAAQGSEGLADHFRKLGQKILAATQAAFWSEKHQLFVTNLPWLRKEDSVYLCDRSLATSILFDQCPQENRMPAARVLAAKPPNMGLSFPPNSIWRYRALARMGKAAVLLDEFRKIWANLPAVQCNHTLPEHWQVKADSDAQWSHAAIAPLAAFYTEIAGIQPTAKGFAQCQIRPQLEDLDALALTAHTVKGPIHFDAVRRENIIDLQIELPGGIEGTLLLPGGSQTNLAKTKSDDSTQAAFYLPPGQCSRVTYLASIND